MIILDDKKRFESIDFMRAIAIISMVQIHIGMYLIRLVDKKLIFYKFMNYFGQVAAPLFLVIVGVDIVMAMRERRDNPLRYFLERGLFLIIIGLIFINLWQADILHYIGLYMIIAYLLLRFGKSLRLMVASVFLFMASFILKYIDYMSGWENLAYRLKDFWTLNGFFNNLVANGFYPIFPWIFFTIIGTIVGEFIISSIRNRDEIRFCVGSSLVGVLLTGVGLFLHFLSPWKIKFYPASISYVIFYTGICLILLGVSFWFLDVKGKFVRVLKPFTFFGTVAFSVYLLHVILGLGYFFYIGEFNTFNLSFVILYTIGLLVILGLICYLFVIWVKNGPFEYLWHKILGIVSPKNYEQVG